MNSKSVEAVMRFYHINCSQYIHDYDRENAERRGMQVTLAKKDLHMCNDKLKMP